MCDLRSQKTPRGILPVNSNANNAFKTVQQSAKDKEDICIKNLQYLRFPEVYICPFPEQLPSF